MSCDEARIGHSKKKRHRNFLRYNLSVNSSKTANAMQLFFNIANFKQKRRVIYKILNFNIN